MGTKKNSRLLQIVLAFIATLLLLQPVSVFAIPQDPNQGGPNANSWTLAERAKQWALAQAFARCISKSDPGGALDKVTTSELQAGNWFAGFGSNTIYTAPSFLSSGSHNESDYSPRGVGNPNGVMDCNNIAKEVSSSFIGDGKFSDMEDMFCTVYNEPKRADDSACRKSNGGQGDYQATSVSANTVLSRISEKVWGTTISLDDAGRYIIYRAAFNEFCKPTQTDTPAPEYKYVVKEYNTTVNKIVDTSYAGSRKNTDLTGTYVYATYAKTVGTSDPPGAKESCKSMVESLNKYAVAYGLWAYAHPDEVKQVQVFQKKTDGTGSESSCTLEGVGWIVCPVAKFIGMMNDALFGIIKGLLRINPRMFSAEGNNKSTYSVWQSVRSLANVTFILAFMVVIYSQLTGAGITNYGIKKLLPRLVIAAILVNISFWVCAIAIDLSNIIGEGLYDLLGVKLSDVSTGSNNLSFWTDAVAFLLAGGVGSLAIGGVALTIGSYGFFGALALLVPTAVSALFAFLVVVFILVARQAILIILIVISPLAFVALLLPNTNAWFGKWRKFFFSMLLMYPVVALLFGGSQLAAAVIREGTTDMLVYILSLVVQVIPLFALPTVMKYGTGILGKLAGQINNPNKGPFDRMKKAGQRVADRQKNFNAQKNFDRTGRIQNGSGGALGKTGSRRRRAAAWVSGIGNVNSADAAEKDKYAKVSAEGTARNYVAERAFSDQKYATSLAGGNKTLAGQVQDYARQAVRDEEKKDIAASRSRLDTLNASKVDAGGASEFVKAMSDESRAGHEMAAYAAEIAARGPGAHFHEALEASRHIADNEKRRMVQSQLIGNMREDHYGVSDEIRGLMTTGDLDSSYEIGQSGKGTKFETIYDSSFDARLVKKLSADAVVSMKPHDLSVAKKLAQSGEMSDSALKKMMVEMAAAEQLDTTRGKIKGETEEMFKIVRQEAARRNITL